MSKFAIPKLSTLMSNIRFGGLGERAAAVMRWPLATYAILAAALLTHVYLCWQMQTGLAFDPRVSYLPFARRLISEGLDFLRSETSVWYPLGTFAYPAAFRANVTAIEAANLFLSTCTLLLLYRTALNGHSARAGLFAAWLYALSPTVAPLVINALTEPPFLFFCAVWLWAVSELYASGRSRWIWIGGVALAAAVNIRATLVTFVYVSAVVAALAGLRCTPGQRAWRKLAALQGIAAALLTLVIAKNWLLFGLPQISSGGGNAFYLGSHSLTGGYDPDIVGLFFDVNGVAGEHQLTVQADRRLFAVGWEMLSAEPILQIISNLLRKTGALLFYPSVLLGGGILTLRSLRIVLLAAAVVGIISGRRRPVLVLAASALAYQVAVHAPLLYTPRYSVSAVDLFLALLAGCGFAAISRWPKRDAVLCVLAMVAACGVGMVLRANDGQVAPLQLSSIVPHRTLWEEGNASALAVRNVDGNVTVPFIASHQNPTVQLSLPDVEGISGNATLWQRPLFLIVQVSSPNDKNRCERGGIDFLPDLPNGSQGVPQMHYPFWIDRRSRSQTFAFGISIPTPTWQSGIDGPGAFRVTFVCDELGVVQLDRVAIAESTYATHFAREKELGADFSPTVPIVEYYNESKRLYFLTWVPDEIASLDAGRDIKGWKRTGQSFNAYVSAREKTARLCRFGGGHSHLYGFGNTECASIARSNAGLVVESTNFPVYLIRASEGKCNAGSKPVYRLVSRTNGIHRYVVDRDIRDQMLASGWVLNEGTDSMCAPIPHS